MGMRKKAALTLLGTGLVAGIGLSMFDALMIYVPIVVAVLSLTAVFLWVTAKTQDALNGRPTGYS
jgi:flagellar basal body-associated protein FliL